MRQLKRAGPVPSGKINKIESPDAIDSSTTLCKGDNEKEEPKDGSSCVVLGTNNHGLTRDELSKTSDLVSQHLIGSSIIMGRWKSTL
jgi:hypothetical protein